MSRKLTASDRKNLIRLASALPKGSDERRAILAGLAKVARFNERDIIKVLKRNPRTPWTTREIWAEIQTEFPKDAVLDWVSEGTQDFYDWGDVEVLSEHPLWQEIDRRYLKKDIHDFLHNMWKDGKLVRHRVRGGGGEWAIPGTPAAKGYRSDQRVSPSPSGLPW